MESFAALRKRQTDELKDLADHHLQHDLRQEDREKLMSAATRVSSWASIGSVVGLGLGIFLAYRLRSARKQLFEAFRTHEKPTRVQFADGRTGECP